MTFNLALAFPISSFLCSSPYHTAVARCPFHRTRSQSDRSQRMRSAAPRRPTRSRAGSEPEPSLRSETPGRLGCFIEAIRTNPSLYKPSPRFWFETCFIQQKPSRVVCYRGWKTVDPHAECRMLKRPAMERPHVQPTSLTKFSKIWNASPRFFSLRGCGGNKE